jgi:hypothetical protein
VSFILARDQPAIYVSEDGLLETQGAVAGRSKIEGTLCSMFYDVPFEKLSDVILGVRVKGIGCDWTAWTEFQPP